MATPTDLPTPVASATPGARHAALLTTPTEPATVVPAFALRGALPGPTLLVTAGVHGAEYASIEAAYRLAALDAAQLAGTLVVLPIVNRPAYRVRAIHGNPIDGKNLNRQCPGDPAGTFVPRLAHWLPDGWLRHADTYRDLHGGGRTGRARILAEAGGQGLFPERDVLTLVDGSRRAMQHHGMLPGTPTPPHHHRRALRRPRVRGDPLMGIGACALHG